MADVLAALPAAVLASGGGQRGLAGGGTVAPPVELVELAGLDPAGVAFAAEARAAIQLALLEARGAELCSTLYTYRSIARALPPASGDESRRRAVYAASFHVLHEPLQRVSALLTFRAEAVACFCESMALVAPPEAPSPARPGTVCVGGGVGGSLALVPSLISLFDTLFVLDAIKDAKAGLINDLAAYKRVRDDNPYHPLPPKCQATSHLPVLPVSTY
eukprot:scaffold402_cov96-Isochrysis_galbana.AAC.1